MPVNNLQDVPATHVQKVSTGKKKSEKKKEKKKEKGRKNHLHRKHAGRREEKREDQGRAIPALSRGNQCRGGKQNGKNSRKKRIDVEC